MFSKLFPDRLSSTWRLGILQVVLLGGSVVLCISVASWMLRKDLSSIARAVVLDDLGEYAAIYNRSGVNELREVFLAGLHEEDQAVRITSPDGRTIFEQIPAAVQGYVWPVLPSSRDGKQTHFEVLAHPSAHQQLLVGSHPLKDGNILWFGRTDAEDREQVTRIREGLWLAGVASGVLMLLPLYWFARHVMQPVQTMMKSAVVLGHGHTDERMVAPTAVPELQEFAAAFNDGLDRIAALTTELQTANDQLAHELRTPLARIRGNLERYLDHTDNEDARDSSARALEEIDRAASLVQRILTIRAGEHNALKLHLEIIDLRELLGELFELYQPAAEERSLRLLFEAAQSKFALIDKQRLTQAIANLLDNAFAYTPAYGNVTLVLEIREHVVRIIVRDTGPGIQPSELQRIWQRHARGSAASAKTPGMGLGLSLVRAIASAHGGSAGCANRDEGGAEFWIELPANDPLAAANAV